MRDIHITYQDSEVSVRGKEITVLIAACNNKLVSRVRFEGIHTQNDGSAPPEIYSGRSTAIRTNVRVKSVKC